MGARQWTDSTQGRASLARANRRLPQLLMPVLLAIAGAMATSTMAAEPWAGTRSWLTVNAKSSAAGDDSFAKSATQMLATLNNAEVVRGA